MTKVPILRPFGQFSHFLLMNNEFYLRCESAEGILKKRCSYFGESMGIECMQTGGFYGRKETEKEKDSR